MILRYLVLFGGIVMMINGCNSLISQQFGTHSLHVTSLEEVITSGVGDADFVEISGVTVGDALVNSSREGWLDANYVYRPLLSPEQDKAWQAGEMVTAELIGWYNVDTTSCVNRAWCQPPPSAAVSGLVSLPPANKHPKGDWAAERITLSPEVVYLKLGDEPLPWYWNLVMLLGGLGLAVIPEARRHRRRLDELDTEETT